MPGEGDRLVQSGGRGWVYCVRECGCGPTIEWAKIAVGTLPAAKNLFSPPTACFAAAWAVFGVVSPSLFSLPGSWTARSSTPSGRACHATPLYDDADPPAQWKAKSRSLGSASGL